MHQQVLLPSRRAVLGAGAAATALAALFCVDGVSGAATPAAFRRSRYQPLVGDTWRLQAEGHRLTVVLREIGELPRATSADAEHAFRLIFAAPHGPRLSSIATLSHGRAGTSHLFVSAVGAPGDTTYYEAIIDRRRA